VPAVNLPGHNGFDPKIQNFIIQIRVLLMNIKWTVLAFIAGAALSWGVYVPMVHEATSRLGSNLRAFLMVGVAYFLVAVLVPSIFIFLLKNDPTAKNPATLNWATPSLMWGLLAGISGAAGALCVIFATKDAVSTLGPAVGPLIVAPLVFAGAPIINTIASITIFAHGKKFEAPSASFYLGLFVAATGMALVMVNKPKSLDAPKAPATNTPATSDPAPASK
jgi:branched-subunit amino acid transport protein